MAFKPLERPEDQCTVRPGAGKRHIQVIAAPFSLEAALATWPRCAVGRDPVAKLGIAAHEAAARRFRVIPRVVPDSVYQQSHVSLLCACTPASAVQAFQYTAGLLGHGFQCDIEFDFVADTGRVLAGVELGTQNRGGRVRTDGVLLEHGMRAIEE